MFSIKDIEIVNWDYWGRFVVPVGANIVTLVGPNGSGKTTFIDACRTLLGIDCSGGRDYKRYARQSKAPVVWLRAVVTNPVNPRSGRSFFPIMTDDVTLGCRIKKSSGDWDRKYFVSPGIVPVEQLEKSAAMLGLREYRQRLAGAGLSEAMRKVLALEQGATGKLSEYTPQMLLKLVWDTFGDQVVLDQYQQAKRKYDEAGQELNEAQRMVDNQAAAVLRYLQAVEHYREWDGRRTRLLEWQTRLLPVKELDELIEKCREARELRRKARAKVKENIERVRLQRAEQARLSELLQECSRAAEGAKRSMEAVQATFIDYRVKHQRAQSLVDERSRLERLIAVQKRGFDAKKLGPELAEARSRRERGKLERGDLENRRGLLVTSIASLRAGKVEAWPDVRAMSDVLAEAHIDHVKLVDIIDVLEPRWQAAIEGALGADRGMLLIKDRNQRMEAMQLAQARRFRHWINWEVDQIRPGPAGSLLSKVKFLDRAPSWIARH